MLTAHPVTPAAPRTSRLAVATAVVVLGWLAMLTAAVVVLTAA